MSRYLYKWTALALLVSLTDKGVVHVQLTDGAKVDVPLWMMRAIAMAIVIPPMLNMPTTIKNSPLPRRSLLRTKNGRMKTTGIGQ